MFLILLGKIDLNIPEGRHILRMVYHSSISVEGDESHRRKGQNCNGNGTQLIFISFDILRFLLIILIERILLSAQKASSLLIVCFFCAILD